MESTLKWLLGLIQHVPWELVIALFVIPYLRKLSAKIKDQQLQAIYLRLVRWAEQRYGAGKGTEKKAAVLKQAQAEGVPLSETHLEAAVYEATREPTFQL